MAMTMSGEQQLAASRETVWKALNDPATLKACIPGCETLEVIGENEFQAVAVNKIGPVKARFKGKVKLTDLDPPNGYKISGEGDGGIAGFAKGGAVVALAQDGSDTVLTYNVDAQVGGKIAQAGGDLTGTTDQRGHRALVIVALERRPQVGDVRARCPGREAVAPGALVHVADVPDVRSPTVRQGGNEVRSFARTGLDAGRRGRPGRLSCVTPPRRCEPQHTRHSHHGPPVPGLCLRCHHANPPSAGNRIVVREHECHGQRATLKGRGSQGRPPLSGSPDAPAAFDHWIGIVPIITRVPWRDASPRPPLPSDPRSVQRARSCTAGHRAAHHGPSQR